MMEQHTLESALSLRELCSELNISRRAVQGYERLQLVRPSGRNNRGHLLYNRAAQERIRQIRLYQQFGFSLKEIKVLFTLPPDEKRAALEQKYADLLARRAQLDELIVQITQQIEPL